MIFDYLQKEINKCKKLKESNRIRKTIDFNKNIKVRTESTEVYNDIENQTQNKKPLLKNETLGIDRNTDKKLKNGQIKIDMTIDFHGMTLDEAFDNLLRKLISAYENNLRCILLITGKGKNTKPGRETIKGNIEKWLKHPLLSDKIIKYVDADAKHGGTGAIFVLLKRDRKHFEQY